MGDQTVFPGILVNHIRVKQGGSGVTQTYDGVMRGDDFTPDKVRNFLNGQLASTRMVGNSPYSLQYNLTVRGKMARSAKMRARLFTRTKNPFEPDVVEIIKVEESDDLKNMDSFRVVTQVTK